MQSFSTFYASRVENHADLNAELCLAARGAMPQGGALIQRMFAVWQSDRLPMAASRHYKHAFAAVLLIKNAIGVLGLRQPPAVREQVLDRNFSIGDEACAFGLPDL